MKGKRIYLLLLLFLVCSNKILFNPIFEFHTLRRIKESSFLPERYLPLEFIGRYPKEIEIPKWPNLETIRKNSVNLSYESKTILMLPYLVASFELPQGLNLIYPLAYLRSLPYTSTEHELSREDVLRELEVIDSELSEFLRQNCENKLEKQLLEIQNFFGISFSFDEIINFIRMRDYIVSYARALRIGFEALNMEAERFGNADLKLDQELLNSIFDNPDICQVLLGLKKASLIKSEDIKDINKFRKILWAFRQVAGPIINIIELSDGYYLYNEYDLRREAILKGRIKDLNKLREMTRAHLEEMIKDDLSKRSGIFYQLTQEIKDASLISKFASAIIFATGNFIKRDKINKTIYYKSGNLAKQVFELEKLAPDTVFIATMNRPEALKKQLEAELANYAIFRNRVPIVVIDDSSGDALSENKNTIDSLRQKYGALIVHIAQGTEIGSTRELVENYARGLINRFEEGKLSAPAIEVLKKRGIIKGDGIDENSLITYLLSNMFCHISGVRNHMLLLAKGDDIIMNFDDDAPPETYLIEPQESDEIISLEDQYLPNPWGIKVTHQRYEALMSLHDEMLKIADFIYLSPRLTKEDDGFIILPIDTFSQTRLLNKTVEDTNLPVFKDDLRGTAGVPADFYKLKDKRIIYVAFPFVGDQDTSALAQLLSYLQLDDLNSVNLQHTNRSAILGEGVIGFAGNTYVIFNRALLRIGDGEIFPSIGRELRLEEPPYVKWIVAPVMGNSVLACYAKIGGAQIREIGERAYVIAGQDITEVIGGIKRFYELAVEEFLANHPGIPATPEEKMARLQELGKKFIEIAERLKSSSLELNRDEISLILEHRLIRARLMAELGRKRAEKEAGLKASTQEVKDIDGALVQWAREFKLIEIGEQKLEANKFRYFIPEKKRDENYFYKIWIEDDKLKYKKIVPDMIVERIKGIRIVKESEWKEIDSIIYSIKKPSKIMQEESLLQARKKLYKIEIEEGKVIIMDQLPQEGKYLIVPALSIELEDDYIKKVIDRIASSMISDGETLILWADVLSIANNWRNLIGGNK